MKVPVCVSARDLERQANVKCFPFKIFKMAALASKISGIPVVDFSAMGLRNKDPLSENSEDIKRLADQVYHAFSTSGFVYLKNHGIPQETVSKATTTVIVCSTTRSLSPRTMSDTARNATSFAAY